MPGQGCPDRDLDFPRVGVSGSGKCLWCGTHLTEPGRAAFYGAQRPGQALARLHSSSTGLLHSA